MAGFLPVLSAIIGWVYFFCWSLSFYPQALLSYRRRTTSGTTVDFPFINCLGKYAPSYLSLLPRACCCDYVSLEYSQQRVVLCLVDHGNLPETDPWTASTGFAAYFVSNVAFYYSPVIRSQYAARHHGLTPTVQFNDVTFALHGLILSVITTSQYFLRTTWGFSPATGTRPNRIISGIMIGCVLGVLLTLATIAASSGVGDPAVDWCGLDAIYAVGYVKVIVTLVKYTPQVIANRRNQSTTGWSIWQILLDFSGGILSVGQQAIDSWLQQDWSGITGNPVKFALGNVSMIYDVLFMVQHYVLYGDTAEWAYSRDEEESLIPDGNRRQD